MGTLNGSAEGFYRAAAVGLMVLDQHQEQRSRFGPGPDARWQGFRGHLGTSSRLDLLCRDAAVKWQIGFSPARVFRLPGLAPDEPFGPDWQGLPEHQAKALWAEVSGLPVLDVETALRHIGGSLGVIEPGGEPGDAPGWATALRQLAPASRVLIGGAQAIWLAARAFAGRTDIKWAEQVTVVADAAGPRQLAGLVAPLVKATLASRVVSAADAMALAGAHDLYLVSDDAEAEVASAIASITSGTGGSCTISPSRTV